MERRKEIRAQFLLALLFFQTFLPSLVIAGALEKNRLYLVDGNNHTGYAQVVEEMDGNGELVSKYLYGHDLVAMDDYSATPATRSYYQYDGLGSVRALSNGSGEVTEEYDYDAYGILIEFRKLDGTSGQLESLSIEDFAEDSNNRYLFTGEQFDADLGMYYLRARYLNTNNGRFHNMDTYEGRTGEPLTLHKYLYAHSNPISNIDPSGNVASLGEAASTLSLQLQISTLNFIGSTGFQAFTGALTAISFLLGPEEFINEVRDDFGALGPLGFITAVTRISISRAASLRRFLPFFNKSDSIKNRFDEFSRAASVIKKRNRISKNATLAFREFGGSGNIDDAVATSSDAGNALGPRITERVLDVANGGSNHAEEKILQYYAQELLRTGQKTGHLRIWVSHPLGVCGRCSNNSPNSVVGAFRERFPLIDLEFISNN